MCNFYIISVLFFHEENRDWQISKSKIAQRILITYCKLLLLLLLLLLKLFKHGSHSAFADFQWAVVEDIGFLWEEF